MMRVYRIECSKTGKGAFSAGLVAKAMDVCGGDESDPYRHPSPFGDVPQWRKSFYTEQFFCCFDGMDHLIRWFDSDMVRKAMRALGGVVRVYEVSVDDVLFGTFQHVFRKSSARLIETLPIPTVKREQG